MHFLNFKPTDADIKGETQLAFLLHEEAHRYCVEEKATIEEYVIALIAESRSAVSSVSLSRKVRNSETVTVEHAKLPFTELYDPRDSITFVVEEEFTMSGHKYVSNGRYAYSPTLNVTNTAKILLGRADLPNS